MNLMKGDCLVEMDKLISDGVVVDAIICDPPYGTTACKWDSVIPFDEMWERLNKLIKPNGAIVLFGSQPFTSALIMSNPKMFKYCWLWEKSQGTNFYQVKFTPLKKTEDICVFSYGGTNNGTKTPIIYNPQGIVSCSITKSNMNNTGGLVGSAHGDWGKLRSKYKQKTKNYPSNILKFDRCKNTTHPTQKPLALMEYLIKTYTNEGETVLDFTMGSGTTGVACKNLNRNFIGIELDAEYFQIATERVENETRQLTLF